MRRIMLAVGSLPQCRIFRNNVGVGWVGKSKRYTTAATVTVRPGDVVIRAARPLHAGLFVGSGDLIGRTTITITPAMVGQSIAVFTSIEVKADDGGMDADQINWREQTAAAGGIAFVARSEQEALDAMDAVLRLSQ